MASKCILYVCTYRHKYALYALYLSLTLFRCLFSRTIYLYSPSLVIHYLYIYRRILTHTHTRRKDTTHTWSLFFNTLPPPVGWPPTPRPVSLTHKYMCTINIKYTIHNCVLHIENSMIQFITRHPRVYSFITTITVVITTLLLLLSLLLVPLRGGPTVVVASSFLWRSSFSDAMVQHAAWRRRTITKSSHVPSRRPAYGHRGYLIIIIIIIITLACI